MATQDWNINVISEKIHELINIREVAYNESGCKRAKEKWQPHSIKQKSTNIHNNDPFIVSSSYIIDKKRRFPCAFCNRDHFQDECTQYRAILTRKKRIRELNLCSRCLRKKHSGSHCSYMKPCLNCNEDHHRALCERKRFYHREQRGMRTDDVTVVQTETHSEHPSEIRMRNEEESIQKNSSIMSYKNSHKMESSVLLLTLKASVNNPLNSNQIKTSLLRLR